MCKSLADGGRRCPCDEPAARAARRRATLAAKVPPEGGIGPGGAHVDPKDAPLSAAWDRDAVLTLAKDVSTALSIGDALPKHEDGSPLTLEEYEAHHDEKRARFEGKPYFDEQFSKDLDSDRERGRVPLAAYTRIHSTVGSLEAAVRVVGDAVASEAERRAGVSAAQIEERTRRFQEEADPRLEQARADSEMARARFYATPEYMEYQRLENLRSELNKQGRTKEAFDLREQVSDAVAAYAATPEYQEDRDAGDRRTGTEKMAAAGRYPGVQEDLDSLAAAYREVLGELRPMGGTLEFHPRSTKDAIAAMKDVHDVFPSDWIDKSNKGALLVKTTPDRAKYDPRHSITLKGNKVPVPAVLVSASFNEEVPEDKDPHFQAGVHEMSHRFEGVVRGLKGLELDFLERRTTDPVTGEREPLVNLGDGMEKEQARPDSFANAYIGKDYGEAGVGHNEVLSMGVESLFSRSNGGLVGAGRYQADTDMRAFVLGAMASAGREDI